MFAIAKAARTAFSGKSQSPFAVQIDLALAEPTLTSDQIGSKNDPFTSPSRGIISRIEPLL